MACDNGGYPGEGGQAPVAEAPAEEVNVEPGAGSEVTDAIAERLLRSLEELQDDYARTVACEPVVPDAEVLAAAAGGGAADGVAADRAASEEAGSEAGDSEGDDAGGEGYCRLGSDDGGSDDEAGGVEAQAAGGAGADDVWKNQAEGVEFADFQGGFLESFANFGAANPALPAPPEGMSQFEATPMSDEDVRFIKEAMQSVSITPPAWARGLEDCALERMVRKALAT
mmetsp:Transcript_2884/g.8168  ORF Transcript_2884/g.8168 Transcript_2884/m.8168 type:complete len:227 (+) Transcript_2884:93-773(+)